MLHLLACLPAQANGGLHASLYHMWQRQSLPHSAIACRAYSLAASLHVNKSSEALLQLVSDVLFGHVPSQLATSVARATQSTAALLQHAAALQLPGAGPGSMVVDDALQLLQCLFPDKPSHDVQQMVTCVHSAAQGNTVSLAALSFVPRNHLGDSAMAGSGSGSQGTAPPVLGLDGDAGSDSEPSKAQCLLQVVAAQHAAAARAAYTHAQSVIRSAVGSAVEPSGKLGTLQNCLVNDLGLSTAGAAELSAKLLATQVHSDSYNASHIDFQADMVAALMPEPAEVCLDSVAALQWLQGLQAQGHGLESAAELPDVA